MSENCHYWWVNAHYMNYEDGVIKRGFNDWGFVNRYKRSVQEKVKIGDKLVIYIIRVMLFGGILEVISDLYFDETRPQYPWRFKTKALILLPLENLPSAKTIFNNLEIINPKNPGANIQGAIKSLSEKDYLTIHDFLKARPNIDLSNEQKLSSFEEHTYIKETKKKTILDFINGKTGTKDIGSSKLSEWVEFCYKNGMHNEAIRLFSFLDESEITTEVYKKTKRIIDACYTK